MATSRVWRTRRVGAGGPPRAAARQPRTRVTDNCTTGDAAVPWRQTAIGPLSPASGPFVLAALQAMDLHSLGVTRPTRPGTPVNNHELIIELDLPVQARSNARTADVPAIRVISHLLRGVTVVCVPQAAGPEFR